MQNLWIGYFGLVVSYLLLSAVFLWFTLATPGKWWLKAILILIIVWYSIALWYTPAKLMGWPTGEAIKNEIQVLSIRIKEPSPEDPGSIFLWAVERPKYEKVEQLLQILMVPTGYPFPNHPRSYRLPYSKELHKQILAMQKQQKSGGGIMMVRAGQKKGKGKLKGEGQQIDNDQLQFRIVNPTELLPK